MIGCFGRLGCVVSDIITPITFRMTDHIEASFWISVIVNTVALLLVVMLISIENTNERRRKELRYLRKTF